MTARIWQLWIDVYDWRDGDSCHASVDLGCRVYMGSREHPVMLRVARIDAPELSTGQPGADATAYVSRVAPPGRYAATSTGMDLHGRPIVDLHLPDGRMLSEAMLSAGQAKPYRT